MNIGFACICKSLEDNGKFKTIAVKTASKLSETERLKRLKSIAVDNIYNTLQILKWCVKNEIYMYRMTSDMIPLATHELGNWIWYEDNDILNLCSQIKQFSKDNNIRLSMHPDQFTVLNSIKTEVVESSIINLKYHNILSNLVGNSTLVLHVGGVSGDKSKAVQRFIDNFQLLPLDIQNKIVLENDDKSFNAIDVLNICEQLHIPMVLDIHHNRCLPSEINIIDIRERIINTWDGKQPKVHLSSGRDNIVDKHHSDYISEDDYKNALEYCGENFDIMFESKEKELAILKIKERYKNGNNI